MEGVRDENYKCRLQRRKHLAWASGQCRLQAVGLRSWWSGGGARNSDLRSPASNVQLAPANGTCRVRYLAPGIFTASISRFLTIQRSNTINITESSVSSPFGILLGTFELLPIVRSFSSRSKRAEATRLVQSHKRLSVIDHLQFLSKN